MPRGKLMPLSDMMTKFQLHQWMRFWYLQLKHAARAQFPQKPVLQADPIKELLTPGDLTKPLSTLYVVLLGKDSPKIERLWEMWHRDIPALDKEGWEDCLDYGPKLVIASKDKLIQVKFLHRIYYTPQKLHCIFPDRDPTRPNCKTQVGTFFHMFWDCPIIATYWSAVFSAINRRLQLSIQALPELALLGVHDNEQRSHHLKLLTSYLLFYVKKEILLKWIGIPPHPFPPGKHRSRPLYPCIESHI